MLHDGKFRPLVTKRGRGQFKNQFQTILSVLSIPMGRSLVNQLIGVSEAFVPESGLGLMIEKERGKMGSPRPVLYKVLEPYIYLYFPV